MKVMQILVYNFEFIFLNEKSLFHLLVYLSEKVKFCYIKLLFPNYSFLILEMILFHVQMQLIHLHLILLIF